MNKFHCPKLIYSSFLISMSSFGRAGDAEELRNDPMFDELDPCCQREYLDRKKANTISAQLRKVDRSNVRYDQIVSALDDVRNGARFRCHCCEDSVDYPALQKLRDSMVPPVLCGEISSSDGGDRACGEDGGSEDEEDDDDFGLDELGIPETDYEREMRAQMMATAVKLDRAKRIGFCVHMEDSPLHLADLLTKSEYCVVHVYDPESDASAYLDVALEALAARYVGTL